MATASQLYIGTGQESSFIVKEHAPAQKSLPGSIICNQLVTPCFRD